MTWTLTQQAPKNRQHDTSLQLVQPNHQDYRSKTRGGASDTPSNKIRGDVNDPWSPKQSFWRGLLWSLVRLAFEKWLVCLADLAELVPPCPRTYCLYCCCVDFVAKLLFLPCNKKNIEIVSLGMPYAFLFHVTVKKPTCLPFGPRDAKPTKLSKLPSMVVQFDVFLVDPPCSQTKQNEMELNSSCSA